MMLFSLFCEGITDYAVIKNILCGYFSDEIFDEINCLVPKVHEKTGKQDGHGGWCILLNELATEYFRDAVLNNEFIIIQIDTDIANDKGFDVSYFDSENNLLSIAQLINNVIMRLIASINSGDAEFYQDYADKIIFCISVHSLECWLYAYHNKQSLKKPKITGCYKALERIMPNVEKTYRCYDELSKPFLKRKQIEIVAEKEPSFRIFINALAKIENQLNDYSQTR
jgi:hypothetical protein